MRRPKPVEIRYVVAKDYYKDGHNLRDEFPVLYSTEAEATAMMQKLEAGSDVSFFNKEDLDEAAVLFVDQVTL